jgi:hypothetical protein
MDAATVLAASGTALPRYIRASMQAGIEIGLIENGSYFGTNRKRAEMLMEEQVHPEQLI